MEIVVDESSVNIVRSVKLEEDEEEFRSCCEDDEVWKETADVVVKEEVKEEVDEFAVKMFFKGTSITEAGVSGSGSGFSAIGVVRERSIDPPVIQVQKKLDFYVEESVASHLALMDDPAEAMRNKIML